jgi:MerR family copper efflux transcriptional regulator
MKDAMNNPNKLTIGKLASQGGVNVMTIRYYEQRGLLTKPSRTTAGYHLYANDRMSRFIKQAQLLGFSLVEIQDLRSLHMRPDTTCADIRTRTKEKITTVDRKIADLQRVKSALTRLASTCRGKGPTSECLILEALETEDSR